MNKDINFKYIEDFVEYIVDRVEKDEDLFLTVVGKFEEIKTILKDVMLFEFINFESLQIEIPIMDNYNSEFIFSIWMNDGILEIGCEKLKNKNGEYDNPCGDETYLLGNVSSKIIPLCEGSDLYFVNIEEYNEECNECCECDCHKDDDGGYTIKVKCDLDLDEAMEIIDKMESRLLEVNKIFKEMNNMKNLFRF